MKRIALLALALAGTASTAMASDRVTLSFTYTEGGYGYSPYVSHYGAPRAYVYYGSRYDSREPRYDRRFDRRDRYDYRDRHDYRRHHWRDDRWHGRRWNDDRRYRDWNSNAWRDRRGHDRDRRNDDWRNRRDRR